MYSSMAKGTLWAEATSNSEKIKPVPLAIVELCLPEGIRQLLGQEKILIIHFEASNDSKIQS